MFLNKSMNDDVIILDSLIIIMAEGGPPEGSAAASSSTSSYSNSDVNEQYLTRLMEMGIHRDDARQVLLLYQFLIFNRKISISGFENC